MDEPEFDPMDPTQEFLMTLIAYPYIYFMSLLWIFFNIFIVPFVGMLYSIDRDLFIERDDREFTTLAKFVPKAGFPTLLAELGGLYKLLYFRYDYFYEETPLLNAWTFTNLMVTSQIQLVLIVPLEAIMVPWAIASGITITTLLLYDIVYREIDFLA